MKIIYILTISFNTPPPPPPSIYYRKKMTQGKGAKIYSIPHTLRLHQRSVGGRGKGLHALIFFLSSTPICPTSPKSSLCLLVANRISINIEELSLRLPESRHRFKTFFKSVIHLSFFMKIYLISFLDFVPKLRPD